jgi:hypothetical protein
MNMDILQQYLETNDQSSRRSNVKKVVVNDGDLIIYNGRRHLGTLKSVHEI